MFNAKSETRQQHRQLMQLLSLTVIFVCLITAIMLINPVPVQASSKVKISSIKFSPKSADISLRKITNVTLTFNIDKNVSGANYAIVQLKNGNKKRNVGGFAKVNGKRVSFTFKAAPTDLPNTESARIGNGKWTVSKVTLKKAIPQRKWISGYWLGWTWWSGHWQTTYIIPKSSLASGTTTSKTSFRIYEGKATSINCSAPKTVEATGTATFKATLKTGGKVMKNKQIEFRFYPSSTTGSLVTKKTKTNSKGVATVTLNSAEISKFGDNLYCSATYAGQAKKYRGSGNLKPTNTKVTRETLVITGDTSKWDGHSGVRTYTARVVSNKKGTPVPNINVDFRLSFSNGYFTSGSAKTNANGIATVNLEMDRTDWKKNGTAQLSILFNNSPPACYKIGSRSWTSSSLPMKQGTIKYKIDTSKIEITDRNGVDWGKGSVSNAYQININGNAFIDEAGKALNIFGTADDVGTFSGTFIGDNITFSEKLCLESRSRLSGSYAYFYSSDIIPAFNNATQMNITFSLKSFQAIMEEEYTYVPASPTVDMVYKWK